MYELDQEYIDRLEAIAGEIQESEELQQYLEEEEEAHYLQLKERFEPLIAEIYDEVAAKVPLQLIPLEVVLLDPLFEGLYLPKILGYSVLRGEVDKNTTYVRPQNHFKDVLLAIANSSNFDIIKKRIGQSIQMGFAMSSDIWVTNLINSIPNKKVRYYLQAQKLDRYRRDNERANGYRRYGKQFQNENFQTAEFPDTMAGLQVEFNTLKHFLMHRIRIKADNASLLPSLRAFVSNEKLRNSKEYLQILFLFAAFFDLEKADKALVNKHLNADRKEMREFDLHWLQFELELLKDKDFDLSPQADQRISELIDRKVKDQLSDYYDLMDVVHTQGYVNEPVHEAIKEFYSRYEGLSVVNECVRQSIFKYISRFVSHLHTRDYPELFEISKLLPVYIGIFSNQQFNQDVKDLCMDYIGQLLKHYTDKRGKDYQDIKKFVSTVFVDLKFLMEKEVVEMFKTRRKRKPADV
ncbi:MAG TPA: hypothetical protein PKB07_19950 [Flavilitoribacter sp.]|nr:hypothetical protein [Flavilitoribacter sp.]